MRNPWLLLPIGVCLLAAPQDIPQDTWQTLVASAPEGVHLQWTLRPAETGWVVVIRNVGSTEVHFGFQLLGLQSLAQAKENGRVHLGPGAKWVRPVGAAPSGVSLSKIRLGEADADAFWRD